MANLTNSNKLIEKIDNLNVVRVSNTAPSNPTLGMAWYDSTSSSKMLKIYNGTSRDIVGPEMIPITQEAYDALSPAEKNNGKYYLITDSEGTIIVNWEDIVGAPTIPENTSDLNNDSGFITGINSSDVTTALGFTPYNASNPSGYQTASQVSSAINTALGSVYRYKGSKTTYSQLPTSGQVTGDVWNIEQADSEHGIKAGDNVAWNGSAWDVLSGTVDLTNYFNKTIDDSDSITQGSNNLFLTGAERTKLGNLSGTNTGDETTATIKTKLGAASASQDGYLKKEDFATFNGKQDALTAGDGITINNGVISSEGESYNAGEGIEIGTYDDYSAMRGPCPEGFHVPTYDEFRGVKTDLSTLGLTAYQAATTLLKLPPCGSRGYSDGNITNQGTRGHYWTCSKSTSTVNLVMAYRVWSSDTGTIQTNRGEGYSIRPFKDTPVIPDSSWTVEYQGTGTAGIYSNSTLGLISISSDGTSWITMADKNLGATTVYNTTDTLSEANCGKLYQRGNNYGFPYSGTITTSNTQVDASNYGPGNYYSSNTFIIASDWTSVRNNDLRGGETGVVTLDNVITNTGVLSVNGQTGDVTIDDNVNTKTFYLSSTSDLTNAQAAYDWHINNKNAIIIYTPDRGTTGLINGGNTGEYVYLYDNAGGPVFIASTSVEQSSSQGVGGRSLNKALLEFTVSNGEVTAINKSNSVIVADFLSTSKTNHPFTPSNNYDPATKKYVDDSLSGTVSRGSTAPSNPTEGQLWYDTTNDVLKVYDGTNWDEVGSGGGATYNSGKGISIGNISRNDTQGPAPDGFHVPLDSEWIAIYNILITTFGLTANAATAGTYLKMPLAGNRDYYTGNLEDVGTWGDYWSATASSTTPNSYAYALHLGASTIDPDDESFRADANSIRCFKNTPVTPNSSWTTLYDGSSVATNAGIFRDKSNGYISISGDGSTWYTIQDKNLGASTVYNQGDTLTSANCGYLYQWGNNYGFPRTGSIATSTTKVDASNYGPTNYYSSSTFITVRSGSPMDWATTKNDDLRGGVSQSSWVENNAISNTGVLSVNGHTGDVIIDETIKQVPSSQDGMPQFTSDLYSYYEGNGTPYPFLIKDGYLYELKEVTSELDTQQGLVETMIYRRTASNNASIYSQGVDSFPLYMLVYIMGSFDHADTTYSDFYTGEIKVGLPKWVINDSVDPAETVATQMNSIASFINKYGINSNASIMYNGSLYMKITTYATEGNYRKVYFMSLSPTTQNYSSGTSRTMNKLVIIYFTYDSSTDTYTYDHYTSNSVMNASPYVLATNVNYTTVYTPQYDGSPATKKYVDDKMSSGTTAPSSPVEGQLWYDSTNDVLKVYNGTSWVEAGEANNVKEFTLSSLNDLTNAQAAYDWYVNGGTPIVLYNKANLGSTLKGRYYVDYSNSNGLVFNSACTNTGGTLSSIETLAFLVSGSSVAMITQGRMSFSVVSSLPASPDANTIYFVK